MVNTPIEIIHAAARNAPAGSLDDRVYLNQLMNLSEFALPSSNKCIYVDVPLNKIVALCRDDFWSEGETWRDVTFRIIGNGWPHEVFDYFESALEEKGFPAPSSQYELRLKSVGGVCECINGNHRLVAGRAWLAEKYHEKAHLKKVKLSSYAVHPEIADFLRSAIARGVGIRAATSGPANWRHLRVQDRPVNMLLTMADEPHKEFAWIDGKLVSLKDSRNFLQKMFPNCFLLFKDKYSWREIPPSIVAGLIDDEWLLPQLVSARSWD